jgi:hypothetical protein
LNFSELYLEAYARENKQSSFLGSIGGGRSLLQVDIGICFTRGRHACPIFSVFLGSAVSISEIWTIVGRDPISVRFVSLDNLQISRMSIIPITSDNKPMSIEGHADGQVFGLTLHLPFGTPMIKERPAQIDQSLQMVMRYFSSTSRNLKQTPIFQLVPVVRICYG